MITIRNMLKMKEDNVWSISPTASVFEALELMAEKNIGALMVMEEDKLVGIFSERDYARKVILKGKTSKETPVGDLMTPRVFWLHPDKTLEDCMVLMSYKHIRHVPVMEEGKVIGIVTLRDAVKVVISQKENRIRDLENYISGGYSAY